MSSFSLFSRLTIVVMLQLLFLVGCGFQMRGSTTIPAEMSRTYIETTDRHSLFYRHLRDNFRRAGVELVDSPLDATATFSIISDITGQRVLSVSARNVPREFEVFYTVMYDLKTEKESLLDPSAQTLTRDYTWDETQVLGKEKEEQIMREAIVEDLIRIILIQLSAL